jgi:hypothetical protein
MMRTFWRASNRKDTETSLDLGRYESFARELVSFSPPDNLSDQEQQLIRDIVVLDHRSLHAFGPYSEPRAEVKALLQNAVIAAGYSLDGVPTSPPRESGPPRNTNAAYGLYVQADRIFHRHLQSKNRLAYLAGVVLGILLLVLVALEARYLPIGIAKSVDPELFPALIFFAGLGSIVSVLLRLSSLDVVREISRPILLISGLGRPFVASSFALVIYLMLASKLVSVSLNTTDAGAYLVVAFLCGFSERFAQDLLDRVQVRSTSQGSSLPAEEVPPMAADGDPPATSGARRVRTARRRAGR